MLHSLWMMWDISAFCVLTHNIQISLSDSHHAPQQEDLNRNENSNNSIVADTARPAEVSSGVKKNPCSTLNSLESSESCPHASTNRTQVIKGELWLDSEILIDLIKGCKLI